MYIIHGAMKLFINALRLNVYIPSILKYFYSIYTHLLQFNVFLFFIFRSILAYLIIKIYLKNNNIYSIIKTMSISI